MRSANEQGYLDLPGDNIEVSWRYLIWLLAGTITDIVEGNSPPEAEATMAESIMRVMGVPREQASKIARAQLPAYPDSPIDFGFRLND